MDELSASILQPRADFPYIAVKPNSLPTAPFGNACDLAVQVTLLLVRGYAGVGHSEPDRFLLVHLDIPTSGRRQLRARQGSGRRPARQSLLGWCDRAAQPPQLTRGATWSSGPGLRRAKGRCWLSPIMLRYRAVVVRSLRLRRVPDRSTGRVPVVPSARSCGANRGSGTVAEETA